MYSRAEMCSESNRKYFSPDKQQRNSEKFRKKLKTHFTDGFVSLVHHLHQLLRSVVKDVLNLFHFWTKTFLWINLNKSHVFLPERHLVFCLCLWKNFLLLLASHLSFCQLSSAPVWHSWVNGIAVQHSAESCLHTSVLNSVAHLVCWTVAEGQDRGERQIPQILGLGASQATPSVCLHFIHWFLLKSHVSFFLPTGDTSGVFFTNISFCVHWFHFRWFKSKSSGDRKEGEICTGVLHFSHSLPKWPMHCILFSTVRRFWRKDKKHNLVFLSPPEWPKIWDVQATLHGMIPPCMAFNWTIRGKGTTPSFMPRTILPALG